MNNIEVYIKKIQKKKSLIGGFDKETVYETINEMCSTYQNELNRLKDEREQVEKELENTTMELKEVNHTLQLLQCQIETEKANQNEYKDGLAVLVQAVDAINVGKEKIIGEAKTTADQIVIEANEKYELLRRECLLQQERMAIVHSNIMMEKQYFDKSMENLRMGLKDMLNRLDELQSNENRQVLLPTSKTSFESPMI